MTKFKRIIASVLVCGILAGSMSVMAEEAQDVYTWSHVWTGISAVFEAGHYGTGKWGTDPSRIVRQSWVAIQDGADGTIEYTYSMRKNTTDIGRFEARKEHINNPFVTSYKYYGWNY